MASKTMMMMMIGTVACLAVMIGIASAATSHTVGGSTGWTNSIPSSSFYSDWASKQTFKVGDTLVFNFPTGAHTVDEVSKSDHDSCSSSNPISSNTNGPASIKLTSAGTHYYLCAISGHCQEGQKLAVTVSAAAATPPSTSSSPSPSPSSSSSSSSSPSPSSSSSSPPSSSSSPPSSSSSPSSSPSTNTTSPSSSTTPTSSPNSSSPTSVAGLLIPALLMVVGPAFFY